MTCTYKTHHIVNTYYAAMPSNLTTIHASVYITCTIYTDHTVHIHKTCECD
jgi:hypothetical protein